MNRLSEVNHSIIKDYILGKNNPTDLEKLNQLSEKDPTVNQLLKIIDELKQLTVPGKNIEKENIPNSFSEIDNILLELQAGSVQPDRAQSFINWIIESPQFFDRLFTKFDQISNMQVEGDLPELQEVAIKSDDMILEELGILKKEKSASKFEELIDRIRGWFVAKPRLAYATVLLLILSISSPFGVRFYNTSFQLMQAENLLQENYQIYMSQTPRLSGGYTSTGISMLMSEEDKKDYLSDAFEKTKNADDYDSDLPEVKQIQAQIFFIQKAYAKADSVLKLINKNERNTAPILNDMGVLEFSQDNYERSIQYFESALKTDPEFTEAYYNLALAKVQTGQIDEARFHINQFLNIEKDEGWKNAALNLLDELK